MDKVKEKRNCDILINNDEKTYRGGHVQKAFIMHNYITLNNSVLDMSSFRYTAHKTKPSEQMKSRTKYKKRKKLLLDYQNHNDILPTINSSFNTVYLINSTQLTGVTT